MCVGVPDYADGNTTNHVAFGFYTTADGGVTGAWNADNSKMEAWTDRGTVAKSVFEGKDEDGDGSLKLTAWFDNTGNGSEQGTYLAVGDAVTSTGTTINANNTTAETDGNLYAATDLRGSGTAMSEIHIDTDYITKLYVTDAFLGSTTYSHDGREVVKAAGEHINATESRVELDGGDHGSAAEANNGGNPIYVGGEGQLFLQTWHQGAITLQNDIYLAKSTHSDVSTYGELRFGNDGNSTTDLSGMIVVLDDVMMQAKGTNAINISGTVTDKLGVDGEASEGGKTLTINGRGYNFSGTVDVTKLAFTSGSAASFSSLNVSEMILGSDVSVTLDSLDLTQTLVISGDILNGLNDVGDSVTLFTVNDLTGWNPNEDGYMLAADCLTLNDEKFSSGLLKTNTALTYNDGVLGLTVVSDPVVPEPATATLSLLALVALAARRRRK